MTHLATDPHVTVKQDLFLAGVGGQGILTIAQAISTAALRRGLRVKQSEVHGMAQRGGGVQSHLRISSREVASDLIPRGRADVLIAVEPLEALRQLSFLATGGTLVTSVNPFVNIGNYPPVESVLERISSQPRHVMIDADRVARAAGSGRAANVAILGAASLVLELDPEELEAAVAEMFEAKGERVVEANRRAFRFGRNAARAYVDGIGRGGSSAAVRHWIETLDSEHLAQPERPDAPVFEVAALEDRLSGAEEHAVEHTLRQALDSGRDRLFEHEVYSIVQLVGAISPPRHLFLSTEELIATEELERFPGDGVVLKIVSPDVVHKTEANGIVFCRKESGVVRDEIDRLLARHRRSADVRGVLVVEHVDRVRPGFGNELFVGIRATREFGPVIAAGLGGIDTEYLADKMQPGLAVAKAVAGEVTPESFLDLFRRTAAYEILSGHARGRRRIVSDGELLRCFRAFLLLARRFSVERGEGEPTLTELEVNPFAFRQQRLVPLDGRGRIGQAARALPSRPAEPVARLLEPSSIAVVGVSAKQANFGRIILRNVVGCGFPPERTWVIKPDEEAIDGVRCVDAIASLPEPVDLLVIAASSAQLPALIRETVDSGRVGSVIMIPGGVGETEGSEGIASEVRREIARARKSSAVGPVFLGPNSLGVVSRPGGYDTLFIPPSRLDKRWSAPARPVALVSQSGAFIVSRMSNLESLDPAFAISLGNQIDVTAADLLAALAGREDVETIGVYVEGFNDLDGENFVGQVRRAAEAGKCIVVYKAGRTEPGRTAAAGHTAAVAGDYEVCQAAVEQAGGVVTDTFKEFEQLIELSTALHRKRVEGLRVGLLSNAGFETVGMADAIQGQRYRVEVASLSEETQRRLEDVLHEHGLGRLANPRNPLDLTPMADEGAYADAVRVMLESDDVDALVVGVVPLTAALKTAPNEVGDPASLAQRLPEWFRNADKPMIVVVDSGPLYEPFVHALRSAGVPVFPSADQAIRSLGRYLCHRVGGARLDD